MALPTTAWRFVDESHADAVSWGELLIGTFHRYAAIENGRADEIDGAIRIATPTIFFEQPGAVAAAKAVGITIGEGGTGVIVRPQRIYHISNVNLFCMSEVGTEFTHPAGVPQVRFEVDVPALAQHLIDKYRPRYERGAYGRVAYEERDFDAFRYKGETPHPMIKSAKFSAEREVRICLELGPKLEAKTFKTDYDPAIRRLIRRIR